MSLYREALGEDKAVLFLGGVRRSVVGGAVNGAEEPGLVEVQLLQLLRVPSESG